MDKLTVVLLTRTPDYPKSILKNLKNVDEIIILIDKKGKDKRQDNINFIFHPIGRDFASHRNYAQQKSNNNWILFIDDDEFVSQALVKECEEVIKSTKHSAFDIRRIDVVFSEPMEYGEQGKLYFTRLVRKDKTNWVRPIHEYALITNGTSGVLNNPLYHIKDIFISQFIASMTLYSGIDAEILVHEGKPFSWFRLFVYPPAKFFQNLLLRQSWRNGLPGLFHTYLMSVQSFTVRVTQWQAN